MRLNIMIAPNDDESRAVFANIFVLEIGHDFVVFDVSPDLRANGFFLLMSNGEPLFFYHSRF